MPAMSAATLNARDFDGHGHHRNRPHITVIPNETISILTSYSGLIITICMVVLCLIRFYLLEKWLFPRYYKRVYLAMDDGLRRGFLNHHIAGATKVVLLMVGAKPWARVLFGKATLHTPLFKGAHATMGDILIVLTQLFVAMYLFELFYRRTMSPIAVAHHVGAVVIAQSAVVLSLDISHQQDATIEYLLCLVWGAFDVLSELWLNVAFIVYRVAPRSHVLLACIFCATFYISFIGTVAETVMIFYLFGSSWSRWELSFKIATPILHVLFTAAQLHAAKILLHMWRKEQKKISNEEADDVESGTKETVQREQIEQGVMAGAAEAGGPDSLGSMPPSSSSGEQHKFDKQKKRGLLQRLQAWVRGYVTGE